MRSEQSDVGEEPQPAARGLWYGLLLLGALMIGLGAFLIAEPHETLAVLTVLVGVLLLVDGVFAIFGAILDRAGGRGLLAVVGILSIVAGIVLVRKPFTALLGVVLLLGVWFVVSGVLRVVYALSVPGGRGAMLALAAVDLIAGVLLIAWPDLGVATLAVILGIVLVIRGGMFVLSAWRLLRAEGPGGAGPLQPA